MYSKKQSIIPGECNETFQYTFWIIKWNHYRNNGNKDKENDKKLKNIWGIFKNVIIEISNSKHHYQINQ